MLRSSKAGTRRILRVRFDYLYGELDNIARLQQECHNSKSGIFWVTGIERTVCRCTFNRYSVIMQFAKLAAGEQLCRRCTHRKLQQFKTFKLFSWKKKIHKFWVVTLLSQMSDIMESSWKATTNTLQPARPQHDRPSVLSPHSTLLPS